MSSGHSMDIEDDVSDEEEEDNASDISIYSGVNTHQPFKVKTPDEVVSKMNVEIKELGELMHIPPTITRIILDRYKWQTDRVGEKFIGLESDQDQESFFRDVGILNPRNYVGYGGQDIVAECLICYDTIEVTGLQCGHKFCRDCWCSYLTTKIVDYGEQTIPCADSKCDIIVEDEIVKSLVSDPDVLLKYNRLICDSYVKYKKNLYWCKTPGCNFIIDSHVTSFVTCKCGNRFCCDCYDDIHAPISCVLLKKWKNDDSATQSYLAVHTKPCPQCHADIEKNGGCPHMTCRNCKHEFCWKCLRAWKMHNGDYKCNTIEEDPEVRKNRTIVERLKICWDRYSFNNQALKEEIQRFDVVWEEYEHRFQLRKALDGIFRSRGFLMYSYAFIYYLKENNSVYMLECKLNDFEARVDKLSEALESYIRIKENDDDFPSKEHEIRNVIVNSGSVCDALRERYLGEIEDNQDHGVWEYREDGE